MPSRAWTYTTWSNHPDSSKTTSFVYYADGNILLQKDPGSTVPYLPGGVLAYRTGSGTNYGFEIPDPHNPPPLAWTPPPKPPPGDSSTSTATPAAPPSAGLTAAASSTNPSTPPPA